MQYPRIIYKRTFHSTKMIVFHWLTKGVEIIFDFKKHNVFLSTISFFLRVKNIQVQVHVISFCKISYTTTLTLNVKISCTQWCVWSHTILLFTFKKNYDTFSSSKVY